MAVMDIQKLVKGADLSRTEICKATGMSLAHLSAIEHGRRKIGVDKIAKLAIALGVTPAKLRPDLAQIFTAH